MLTRFLDLVLGPKCVACGERVYPKDHPDHDRLQHAGDPA